MKLQDIIFLLILGCIIFKKNSRLAAGIGLLCLLFAIPLFAKWIFFTAERLTWYGAGFIIVSMVLILIQHKNQKV